MRVNSLPLEGKGDRVAVDEVQLQGSVAPVPITAYNTSSVICSLQSQMPPSPQGEG